MIFDEEELSLNLLPYPLSKNNYISEQTKPLTIRLVRLEDELRQQSQSQQHNKGGGRKVTEFRERRKMIFQSKRPYIRENLKAKYENKGTFCFFTELTISSFLSLTHPYPTTTPTN